MMDICPQCDEVQDCSKVINLMNYFCVMVLQVNWTGYKREQVTGNTNKTERIMEIQEPLLTFDIW